MDLFPDLCLSTVQERKDAYYSDYLSNQDGTKAELSMFVCHPPKQGHG
ncbi:hypothetical protein SBDP1_120013 [Syntrophobacter sp. SbD1]|nr:hypothetical protein SBDP1_120013 [Syntrophobacter sp. SbD1]